MKIVAPPVPPLPLGPRSTPSLTHRADIQITKTVPDVATDAVAKNVNGWLFLVNDGGPLLAASAETSNNGEKGEGICVTRLDPTDAASVAGAVWYLLLSNASLPWGALVDSDGADLEYNGFSDHWHIYAHGYHWIAASITAEVGGPPNQGVGVMLVKFSFDATTGWPHVEWEKIVKEPRYSTDWTKAKDGVHAAQLNNSTNDLFLVLAGHGGVAVGVRHSIDDGSLVGTPPPDTCGHTIIEVWGDGTVQPEYDFFGDGFEHMNCASANRVIDTSGFFSGLTVAPIYRVLAPQDNRVHVESPLFLMEADRSWDLLSLTRLIEQVGYNFQMASEVQVAEGIWAVAYQKTEIATVDKDHSEGEPTVELVVVARGGEVGTPVTVTSTGTSAVGSRPHVMYWKGAVLVAWDGAGAWVGIYDITW